MKRILILLASITMSLTFGSTKANAQSQDFFVRAGANLNYYWGDDDSHLKLKDHVSPAATIIVGKWFNPYWAVQLGGSYGKVKGAAYGNDTPYSTGEPVTDPIGKMTGGGTIEKFNVLTIQPEIVYNVSNGMCGYNAKRVFNVLFHLGPSYGHSSANGQSANAICATVGLTATWRICRNLQFWGGSRFTIFNKGFDKVTYRDDVDCMGNISAGLSVNFGK